MTRLLLMAAAVAAVAAADASAFGRPRACSGCGCARPATVVPSPAAPCGNFAAPLVQQGVAVQGVPMTYGGMPAQTVVPGAVTPAAPATPDAHRHH